jgi:tape measure domain-containing protein
VSKSVDVDLRIRAKNLAGRTLAEINDQVELLAKNNDLQATSAERAARSMRELTGESRQLAGAYRELSKREGITRTFVEQQAEIKATSQRLGELTDRYRALAAAGGANVDKGTFDALAKEIIETNNALTRLVKDNDKAAAGLKKIGVDAARADEELAQLSVSAQRAGAAYRNSVDAINDYSAAQKRAAAASAEAARRQGEVAAAVQRSQLAFKQRADRGGELSALRADIEARSAQARATQVQAEAERRLAAEQANAAARQERATAAIRESVAAYDAQRARRVQAAAALGPELAAQERSNVRRERLIALLGTERVQRIAALEATRRQSAALDQNTGAANRNAAASRQAGTNLALFSDVGRKSLGTYQRLRGQVLGLAAAYIGFYQAIATAQKAIAATNRDASLRVGLRTINQGDLKAAASDYAFLREEADRLGLVFDDLAPNFANIAIAAKALGLNTTQIRDVFTDTATAAAAMNLSVEDTEGVFRAMTQIFSKGKVQAEELRGQLGDRLPGAVVKFAQANNIALTDLDKQLKEGTIGVGFLIKGIQGYAQQYDAELENVGSRLQAYINRATNSYNDFLRALLTGANDQKLKSAFERIEQFFRGAEGQKFAESIATVFGKVIDVFIALADNIDLVTEAIKLFIGLQLLKFLNDSIIGVVRLGSAFVGLTKWVTGYNAAALIASGTTATLTGRLTLLLARLGPIAAVLGVVTTAVYGYIRGIDQATERTERYVDALSNLTFAKTEEGLTSGLEGAKNELSELDKELEKVIQTRDKLQSKNMLTAGVAYASFVGDEGALPTRNNLNEAINKKLERQKFLLESIEDGETRLKRLADERVDKEAKDRLAPLPASPVSEKKEKEAKGPSEKALRAEENARLNSARAIQKELLDLDQQIFDARTSGDVRTSEQVQQNYALRVQQIESQIAEAQLGLDRLEQNARTANEGNLPEAEAALLATARERLETLRLALNTKAMEASETQDIEIQERAINDLLDERNSKIEYINALKENGLISEVEAFNAINETQAAYNGRIQELVGIIMPLLQAIAGDDTDARQSWAQKMIADMELLTVKVQQYTAAQKVALNLGSQFAAGAASAIVKLGQGLAGVIDGTNSLSDAFKGAMDAFRTFAADFLQQIAQMIIQAIILQAIKNAISGGSGGYVDAAIGAFTQHTGGIVGAGNSRRMVNPAVFAGAGYFHEGGLPGLRANEVATILKKGEEVVTEDNPRHVGNQAAASPNIQLIASIDPVETVLAAMSDTRVVKRVISVLGKNRNQLNQNTRSR